MSKLRGILPVFLATAIGIGNGLYAFGPSFKDQQLEKDEQATKAEEVVKLSEHGTHDTVESLRNTEAAASRSIATKSALRPIEKPGSWWPNMSLWTKDVNKPPMIEPGKNDQETSKDKP